MENIQNFDTYNGFMTGGLTAQTVTSGNIPSYWYSWPNYTQCWHGASESKTEKAYQVLRALMKAKIIKVSELAEFFDAMDATIKVL